MWGKKVGSILLLISLTLLSGCWSRKELNELAIVMALGIDSVPEGYEVSAQVMNSSEAGGPSGGSSGSLPVITYKAVGKTLPDALQRMLSTTPRILYLSHIRVLVFGEEVAREGVSDVLDFINRNHQLRTDFFLLVAKNSKASEILEVITPFEHIPANSLYSSILVAHKNWAATGKVTLQQFIIELERGGSNPVMSGVQLKDDVSEGGSIKNLQTITPKSLIQHAGIAVFQKDRLVGWLGEASSKSLNYVLNEVNSTTGNVTCEGGTVAFLITKADSSIDIKLNPENEPEFTLNLKTEANLTAIQSTIDLSKTSSIENIRSRIEKKFIVNIKRDIKEVQEKYGSDIFGFGEALHRQYPDIWRSYRKRWEDRFRTVKISVRTSVTIRRIGSVIQPQKRELELK
ncbi:Ger(x)C family spore germination protein [Paenibacillus monticola]|uniref:Ger(X)C family spore germination protein n=1 Tax=Paenibacillus monticola TaxID=2666075 RepID=A0A7X2L3P8_9BACL|nr:Ger(x)C family spore germination protein [Paenibacillus monticola]MRN56197.1 Ger(x)C family spore germination protein [Paenibacillus monticola]